MSFLLISRRIWDAFPQNRNVVPFSSSGALRPATPNPYIRHMVVRETKTGTAADGSPRVTFRPVESWRVGGKVRQQTLPTLGRYFAVGRADWPLPVRRVDEPVPDQMTLEPGQPDPTTGAEARRIAARLPEGGAGSRPTATGRPWTPARPPTATDGRSAPGMRRWRRSPCRVFRVFPTGSASDGGTCAARRRASPRAWLCRGRSVRHTSGCVTEVPWANFPGLISPPPL